MSRVSPRVIALDPFFDGGDGQSRRPVGVPMPGTQNYRDINTEHFEDGRPIGERISAGPAGLRGVVIPHATMGGTVRGIQPHNIQDMHIAIDPHIEGQSSLALGVHINAAAMQRAGVLAAETTPEPDSIQTQRLRGAATMHALAVGNGNGHSAPQAGPATIAAPNLARHGQPAQRVVRPLQAFTHSGGQPTMDRQHEARVIDLDHSPQVMRQQAPTIKVLFEIEHFGTHEAMYHDVLVEPGFIILVYKTAYEGSKYFPPSPVENAPPLALTINGGPEAYLVHTTGVRYAYEGSEFCMLMVERTVTLQEQQAE